jgi:hypothetical protein
LAETNIGLTRYLTDMAKRSYSRKGNKIQPAVQTLTFAVPASAAGVSSFVDLSQVASLVNRRFYRQGINWAVAGFKFIGTAPGVIQISKLPNTWVMSNAWEKSFRTWQRMNNEALEESESVRPKFLDFKIYADSAHHGAGFAGNLLPMAGFNAPAGTFTYTAGEWEASKIVVPKTDGTDGVNNFELIATGPNFPGGGASGLNAVSLIEGYAASRGLPNVLDPNAPDDAADVSGPTPENWMSALFNDGTTQDDNVITDMISENNIAPYPFENDGVHTDTMYPNGANNVPYLQTHDYEFVTGTTIGGTTRLKGGNFPCGLIRFDVIADVTTVQLQIDLVPGNHRGYLCEPMTEM